MGKTKGYDISDQCDCNQDCAVCECESDVVEYDYYNSEEENSEDGNVKTITMEESAEAMEIHGGIDIDIKNIEECVYDKDEFKRGLDEHSYVAGAITALSNAGVPYNFIMDYIINKETIVHNIEYAKMNNEASIELAKVQNYQVEKNQM